MTNINIMKKGDSVIAINEHFLAVKRKDGTVDVFNVCFNENNEFFVDPIKASHIGYGDGTVSKEIDDGETTIFSF